MIKFVHKFEEGFMENKGLCKTCSNDKTCSFPRHFPVIICEEFDIIIGETETKREKKKGKK